MLSILSRSCLMAAVAVGLVFSVRASAQQGGVDVDALLKKVAALESRVAELETENSVRPESVMETEINALTSGAAYRANDLNVTWSNTTRHTSDDKAFDIKIGGRIQTDFVFGTEDDDFASSFAEVGDYVEFRRARIFISGTVYSNVFFKAQYDFAGSGVANWKDVYIGLKKVPVVGNIIVGQFFIPFSLEQQTSSNNGTFIERGMPVEAFTPDRQTGIMFTNTALEGDRLYWGLAIYRDSDNTGDAIDNDIASGHDGAWNIGLRIAGVLWEEEGGQRMLMIGGAFYFRNPDDSVVRFRSRPEIHTPQLRIVDTNNGTGDIVDADTVLVFQFEIAVVLESFSAQAEFIYTTVDTQNSGDPAFWGGYVSLSYFLTGEHRPYKKSSATFDRIIPNHDFGDDGSGAWELALRFSYLDLEDEGVTGGEAFDITFGVNWYLNPATRVMFNYIYSDVQDGTADGVSHWFGFRFQINF